MEHCFPDVLTNPLDHPSSFKASTTLINGNPVKSATSFGLHSLCSINLKKQLDLLKFYKIVDFLQLYLQF